MAGAKTKILTAILIADAVAAGLIVMQDNRAALTAWLFINAGAVIPAVIITFLYGRKRHKNLSQKHSGRASFLEHKRKHGMEYKTMNGEVVKSGGERMIADYFHRSKIRYEYEKSANGRSSRRISRPDFYLPDYDVYVEYWGMVDTEDSKTRKEYVKGMEWKMAQYRENGIKIISIYPQDIDSLDSVFRKRLKETMSRNLD